MSLFIRLHPADDVVIARAQLMSGTSVDGVAVRGLVPPGHKVATRAIQAGEAVRRYNQIIGFASTAIQPGEHVHTHNLNMGPEKGNFERDPKRLASMPRSWASNAQTAVWPRAITLASCPA